ncbi:MAG: hypothetical protein L6R42_006825 [Xanthoria sp. 1 TBL-2021]|nr:MAG: hypothetical protein L6R42_006825 [Xanthoria sp. 1 TBL-2021]
MPSPAALAKFVVAIMITPFNQEVTDTPFNQKAINTPLNQEVINSPFHQEAIHTPVDQGSGDTLVYGTRHTPLNTGGIQIAGNSGIYMQAMPCQYSINTDACGTKANLDGDLAHKVSAAGPDKGNWCTLYA